jgi:hypothetical protein
MNTLFQQDYAVVSHNTDKAFLVLHLIHEVNFENYKTVLNTVLDNLKGTQVQKLVVDQRYVENIGMAEKAWLIAHWFPALQKTVGERFQIAVISSAGLFARIGTEYIVNSIKSKSNFDIQQFNSMNEAVQWLA